MTLASHGEDLTGLEGIMQARVEVMALVKAVNEGAAVQKLALGDEEYRQLERILGQHPEVWPTGVVDTLQALQRRLHWEDVAMDEIPVPLQVFFEDKFRRDLDPMAMARRIGQDICSSCSDCGCRC